MFNELLSIMFSILSPSNVMMRKPSLLLAASFNLAKPSREFIVLIISDYLAREIDKSPLFFFMTSIVEADVLKTL